MNNIVIPDGSVDNKFKYVQKILNAILRRSVKHVVAVQPPFPISHYTAVPDDNGVVMSYMFPAKGKITSGTFWAMDFPTDINYAELHIEVKTPQGTSTVQEIIKARCMYFDLTLEVAAGTCLTVKVPTELNIGNIWCGFMYELEMQSMQSWNLAIEALETNNLE